MYRLVLILLVLLVGCNQSNVKNNNSGEKSTRAVITIKTKKEPVKKGKGKVFLYNLKAEQTAYRLVEEADSDNSGEPTEKWLLVNPADEKCEPEADPCSCAGLHEAKVVLIFWPGEYLQIEWQGKKGAGGYYHNGKIADSADGWNYVSKPFVNSHECKNIELVHDQFQRLLKMSMQCNWLSDEGLCKGEDSVVIEFPSVEEVRNPEPENLPWNAEVEGQVYRFNDVGTKAPQSASEAGEGGNVTIKEDAEK